MPTTSHPLDIDPPLVLNIGMLAIQWARVEFVLKKITVSLLGAEAPNGLLLTGDMGFRAIDNFISCVIESKPAKHEKMTAGLALLMEEARRIYALRNSFVHNSWIGGDQDTHYNLLVVRFRGKIQLYSEHWTEKQLSAAVQETIDLLIALTAFAKKNRLFKTFHKWEKQATSQGTHGEPRQARPRGRSPKTEELLTQLGALPP